MKKYLILLLLGLFVFTLAGCNTKEEIKTCDIACQIEGKYQEQADYMKQKMRVKNEAFALSGEISILMFKYNELLSGIKFYTNKNQQVYNEILDLVNGETTSQQLQPLGLELEQQLPKLSGQDSLGLSGIQLKN